MCELRPTGRRLVSGRQHVGRAFGGLGGCVSSRGCDVTIEEHMANDWVELRDGTRCMERYVCHCSVCESHPKGPAFADDRYSLGIYAGRYCDKGWKLSGFRDEGPSSFDAGDAGERYDDFEV